MTTGEGGAVVCPSAEVKERIDSERNQGRAPDMGWLDHDRLGFNYRLDDLSCALGLAQLERLDGMLAARARVAALYGEALAGSRGWSCRATTRAATGAAGSSTWSSCRRRGPRRRHGGLRERGVDSKPYLPAIHLSASTASASATARASSRSARTWPRRSLALPFYPELTDGEVEQVVEALRDVIGRWRKTRRVMSFRAARRHTHHELQH